MEMSKEELAAFIKESLKEIALANQLSAEDEAYDEADFEDSLGVGSEDYYGDDINTGLEPLSLSSRNAGLAQGGDNSYDDEFSDLNGYQEFGSDYKVNSQDLPSVFSEEELAEMIREGVKKLHKKTIIENRLEQINQELNALNNPEAWESAKEEAQNQLRKKTIGFTNVIPKERLMNEGLTEKGKNTVKMWIERDGSRNAAKKMIDSVISRILGGLTSSDLPDTMTFANGLDAVEELINVGEFDNAYEEAKNTAKEMIEEEGGDLFGENKYSDAASDFIGKEIGHLQKDKGYAHDRAVAAAINIAKDKGYKVPKAKNESIKDIMSRANNLMAEAKKLMNKNK